MGVMNWMRNNKDNAVLAAIVAGVVAAVVSLVGSVITYNMNISTQDRQARLEEALRFTQTADRVISAGGDFIAAINDSKDLTPAKERVKNESVSLILESERMKLILHNDTALDNYLDAVQQFQRVAQATSSAADIGLWIVSFDKMVDTRGKLSESIYKSLGLV